MSDADDLYEQGVEAFRRGESARSRELNERSLALARADGDGTAIVNALMGLARVALRDQDPERVHELADEARAVAVDERSLVLPLHLDAEATRLAGDLVAARALFEQSIELNRRLGNEGMVAAEQANLSWVEINEGRIDEAERLLEASRAGAGEHPYMRAFLSIGFARCAAERGDRARARALLAEADATLADTGLVLDPADQPEYDRTVDLAREQ